MNQLEKVIQTYEDMIQNSIKPDEITYSTLIKAYGDMNQQQEALKIYLEMEKKIYYI